MGDVAGPPGARPLRLTGGKSGFTFYTERRLVQLTGVKAHNLDEFLAALRTVGGASIFYHTHHSFLQRQFAAPLYNGNDFATWTATALGEGELAERLGSINILDCESIRDLRQTLIAVMEDHLAAHPDRQRRQADPLDAFHFASSRSFVFPAGRVARSLEEFAWHVSRISVHSLFYHVFVARLNPDCRDRDFAVWIEEQLGLDDLAGQIRRLDPYPRPLEDLRSDLVNVLARYIDTGGR